MSQENKCCSKFKNVIKKCDELYSYITFKIDDEVEYKSMVGGINSILFAIFSLWYIISQAIPFIKKQNISLIDTSKVLETSPMIDFRFNNFNFAIAVFFTDPMYEEENLAIDETWKYFDYVLTLREWEGEADITDLVFETRFCTLNDFFNKFTEEQFDFSGIWYMLCPIIDDKSNFTIEGDFTEDYYKYLM